MTPLPTSSLDLLQRNEAITDNFGSDSFFISARIIKNPDTHQYTVTIDNTCPILVNDKKATEIGAPETMLRLSQGRSSQLANQGYVALAGGAFIWVGDKIALLERDAKAPALPLHWTNPSGMCSENPLNTSIKELSEEIAFYAQNHDERDTATTLIRLYQSNHHPSNDHIRKRLSAPTCIAEKFIEISSPQCVEIGGDIGIILCIGSETSTHQFPHIHIDPKLNTFVLNRVFELKARNSGAITPIDAEPFNRRSDLFSLQDARSLGRVVSTTADYLDRTSSTPALS